MSEDKRKSVYKKRDEKRRNAYRDRKAKWIKKLEYQRGVREKIRGTKEGLWDADAWCSVLSSVRRRAKQKGLPFNLTAKYMISITPEFCPVLGIPLYRSITGGATPNSPSIDRIHPHLGYIQDNVIVVSMLANSIRSSATPDQIMSVGNFYKNLLLDKSIDHVDPNTITM